MTLQTKFRYVKTFIRSLGWKITRLVNPIQLSFNNDGKVLLHLGCGPINAHGYTNVDLKPLPHVHYVHAAYPLEMFASESIVLVYASHILEHFSWHKTVDVLKEWYRIIKPGGTLRLGVPDFPTLLQIYQDTGDPEKIYGPLMGGQHDSLNFHYAVFDHVFLSKILMSVGFYKIQKWDPETVDNHDFHDTTSKVFTINGRDYAISLNLEAKK